jgi:hypothetical protein
MTLFHALGLQSHIIIIDSDVLQTHSLIQVIGGFRHSRAESCPCDGSAAQSSISPSANPSSFSYVRTHCTLVSRQKIQSVFPLGFESWSPLEVKTRQGKSRSSHRLHRPMQSSSTCFAGRCDVIETMGDNT